MNYTGKTIRDRMQLSYEPTQTSLPHNKGTGYEKRQDVISGSDEIQVRIQQ